MSDFRIISEDPITGFIYYQHKENGNVFYYGGFAGKKSGFFGDKRYWEYMLTMPNRTRLYGPFMLLDYAVPFAIDELSNPRA